MADPVTGNPAAKGRGRVGGATYSTDMFQKNWTGDLISPLTLFR
jgi:hypothetical protein